MEPKLKPYQQFVKDCLNDDSKKVIACMSRQTGKSMTIRNIGELLKDIFHPRVYQLITGVGTVYGSDYYTVEPVGGDWNDIYSWCDQTFGSETEPLGGPGGRWYTENRKIWFRDLKDRDWFVMRWNS